MILRFTLLAALLALSACDDKPGDYANPWGDEDFKSCKLYGNCSGKSED